MKRQGVDTPKAAAPKTLLLANMVEEKPATKNQKAEKLVGARRGRPPKADEAIPDKSKPSNQTSNKVRAFHFIFDISRY